MGERREGTREPYISTSRIGVAVALVSNIPVSRECHEATPLPSPSAPPSRTVETCEPKVPRAACKFAGSKFRVFSLATAPRSRLIGITNASLSPSSHLRPPHRAAVTPTVAVSVSRADVQFKFGLLAISPTFVKGGVLRSTADL